MVSSMKYKEKNLPSLVNESILSGDKMDEEKYQSAKINNEPTDVGDVLCPQCFCFDYLFLMCRWFHGCLV